MAYKIKKYRNIIEMAGLIKFKDVARALKFHYPHPRISKGTMKRYQEIIKEMSNYKEYPEKDKNWSLIITMVRPYKFYSKTDKKWLSLTDIGEEYYGIHGKKKGEKFTYAIEFTRWEEAANWKIDLDTLKHYTPAEILAHFLWEMTFCGYTQSPIQKKIKEINRRCDLVKKDPKKYSIPYDPEKLKNFGEKDAKRV
jgi:hypothetical protein